MIDLELQNLYVGQGERYALTNVSLRAQNAELCAVVGENGAGKSTLLDAIAGLCRPLRGHVRLDGIDLRTLTPLARATRISSLGQNPMLWMEQNVRSYIGQGLVARRGAGKLLDAKSHTAIETIAEEFAIEHLLERHTGELSGGELRRIQIARCLIDEEVECFVLDEPLSGVDIKHRSFVCHALSRRAERGHLVFFSVHDLGCAYDVATRVIALKQGRVIADGQPVQTLTPTTIEETFGIPGAIEVGADGSQSVLRLHSR